MGGGWIKFWKDTFDDPRLMEAAGSLATTYQLAFKTPGGGEELSAGDALRFASNALRGALLTLWIYADEHIHPDDTLPLKSNTLDAFVGIEGFFTMVPRDWVAELDDGTIKLPGYCEKNGLIAKEKRAFRNKTRQANWRSRHNGKSNAIHNPIVTRNDPVTKCGDLDLDSDSKNPPIRPPLRKAPPKSAARPTRIPADWQMSPDMADYARTMGIEDPNRTAEDFKDYWTTLSGGRALKLEWPLVWRKWCRNQFDLKQPPRAPNGQGNGHAKPNDSAAWSEAKALGREIGFRDPYPAESVTAYAYAVKQARDMPPKFSLSQLQARAQR